MSNKVKSSKIALGLIFLFLMVILPAKFGSADTADPFVVGVSAGPGKIDPQDAYDSNSLNVIRQVCEGLYVWNYSSPEMNPIPCLATDYGTWDPSLLNFTIALKTGVTFHDGTKFNASAVKWVFDRIQYFTSGLVDSAGHWNPGQFFQSGTPIQAKSLFYQYDLPILNRTVVIDEYTIRFVLNFPSSVWESLLAFSGCFIHLPDPWDPVVEEYSWGSKFNTFLTIIDDLIGTGPFELVEYDIGNFVRFQSYDLYHRPWKSDHIEEMMYLIIPDSVTMSLAVLNHEVHYGSVLNDYSSQFDADPDLVRMSRKALVVYYIGMNHVNQPTNVRIASQFIWDRTNFLIGTLGGAHYDLTVPVPDGMQYHHEGFEGDPELDVTKAREYILNSTDPDFALNITNSGLTIGSLDTEWIAIAESSTPLAWYNFTRYSSSLVSTIATQLQVNLKQIGIRMEILDSMSWDDWLNNYVENPSNHHKITYHFGGWGPDFNDPINMIDPLYRTGASSNTFSIADSHLETLLDQSNVLSGVARQDKFYEIQEYFVRNATPSFYILQLGGSISFNRHVIDENSVTDLLNGFSNLYFFNVQLNDVPAPFIADTSGNSIAEMGYTGENIYWTVTDTDPSTYTIELVGSGTVVSTTAWTSGSSIIYAIPDGFGPGTYTYKITLKDVEGHVTIDYLSFTVVEETVDPILISTPIDIVEDEGYTGISLSWTATDDNPLTYSIKLNQFNVVLDTGWISGTPITYDIPVGFNPGTYTYTINITDQFGNYVIDSVVFTVNAVEPTIPGYGVIWVLSFSIIAVLVVLVTSKYKKRS